MVVLFLDIDLESRLLNTLEHVIYRLTFVGAVYLGLIALIPEFLIARLSVPFYLGGTSLLIVVVVAMDFFSQIQTHLFTSQ